MTALGIGLAVWAALTVPCVILLGRHLKRTRRSLPFVRTAANDDFIRFSPPSRRRTRRGR